MSGTDNRCAALFAISSDSSNRIVPFQFCRRQRRTAPREWVKNPPTRQTDFAYLPHDLFRFLRLVDALHPLHVCRLKHPRQHRHRAINRQFSVARPDRKLCLLPKPSLLRAAGQFVPDQRAAPLPACPLHRIREQRHLPPIAKRHQHRTVVTPNARQRENICHHVQPATRIHLVTGEIWERAVTLGVRVFLRCRSRTLGQRRAAARIRRIGNHRIKRGPIVMGKKRPAIAVVKLNHGSAPSEIFFDSFYSFAHSRTRGFLAPKFAPLYNHFMRSRAGRTGAALPISADSVPDNPSCRKAHLFPSMRPRFHAWVF